jgi:hypothetical protein
MVPPHPPKLPWPLFVFENGSGHPVHPKEIYGALWSHHLDMACVMIPCGFGKLCCALDLTPEELLAALGCLEYPKEWQRQIKSRLWSQPPSKKQIVNAINEKPMVMVKALQCLLLLDAVIKQRGPGNSKPNVWRSVKIVAVLFRVNGPKEWLAKIAGEHLESLQHLEKRFAALGFLPDWQVTFDDLMKDIAKGHCVTFAMAKEVCTVLDTLGVPLKVELAKRAVGNFKAASSLLVFIAPPR